mgnify:CR=1 FL=1
MPNERDGWVVSVSGSRLNPEDDALAVEHFGEPRIYLEITIPGIRTTGNDQRAIGRKAIQEAIVMLQAALDSPSELAGFTAQK